MNRTSLRTVCYIRTSTDMEDQEGSYTIQQQYFTNLIQSDPGLEYAGCYGDFGKSGRNISHRPGFCHMLRDCEEGLIDVIYTKSVSRFARNISDLIDTLAFLHSLDVYVYFEKENIYSNSRDSELLLHILGIISQEESRSFGENVRLGLLERVSTGHPVGKVPYGYRRINKDAEWEICESEARLIRTAFRMAAAGNIYPDIIHALNSLEVTASPPVNWTRDRLRRTLRNVAYKGDVLTGKVYRVNNKIRVNHGERPSYYLEGHHSPIIDPYVFDRVQHLMDSGMLRATRPSLTPRQMEYLRDTSWLARQDALESQSDGARLIEGGYHEQPQF